MTFKRAHFEGNNASAAKILRLEHVTMAFGGLKAINDLSITIDPGKVTALIGPNGAGKTTIFNVITGLLTPQHGRVTYGDQILTGSRPDQAVTGGIGRSFQDLKLFQGLTCLENVLAASTASTGNTPATAIIRRRAIKRELAERIGAAEEVLAFTGLSDKRDVLARELGYAEAKMLSIARVLMLDTSMLLLDEPCSGLDHGTLDRVRTMLDTLIESGKTICLIEHNMALVRDVADSGIFLEQGGLVASDTIENLLADQRMRERYLGIEA